MVIKLSMNSHNTLATEYLRLDQSIILFYFLVLNKCTTCMAKHNGYLVDPVNIKIDILII